MDDAGTVLLIHGGLWEDIGADWFWRRTGVVAGLEERGFTVLAPDRIGRAANWTAEAAHLADVVTDQGPPGEPLTVLSASFGCAATVRQSRMRGPATGRSRAKRGLLQRRDHVGPWPSRKYSARCRRSWRMRCEIDARLYAGGRSPVPP